MMARSGHSLCDAPCPPDHGTGMPSRRNDGSKRGPGASSRPRDNRLCCRPPLALSEASRPGCTRCLHPSAPLFHSPDPTCHPGGPDVSSVAHPRRADRPRTACGPCRARRRPAHHPVEGHRSPAPPAWPARARPAKARAYGLILDLRLPLPLDGWALLGRLRTDPALRTLPVLVCTGDERAVRDQAAVLQHPGCAVLAKPFDLADLLATLVRLGVAP